MSDIESALQKRVDRSPPSPLYHYTSQEGLLGIIEDGALHCSHAQFLSDAEELRYTTNLVEPLLRERIQEIAESEEVSEDHISLLGKCLGWLNSLPEIPLFVFSLSEAGNLLSQWRAYCPDEGGYAIGFDTDQLEGVALRQGYALAECAYDSEWQTEVAENLLSETVDTFVRKLEDGQEDRSELVKKYHSEFGGGIAALGARFKHPHFSEEREWRLISEPNLARQDSPNFRRGPSTLVPYKKLQLEDEQTARLPISKVWVGPTPHPDLALQSVRQLLGKHGLEETEVAYSGIPYRTW